MNNVNNSIARAVIDVLGSADFLFADGSWRKK
jgi:hypothetical protein